MPFGLKKTPRILRLHFPCSATLLGKHKHLADDASIIWLGIECVNIANVAPFVWNLIGRHHVIKRYCVASDLRKVSLVAQLLLDLYQIFL